MQVQITKIPSADGLRLRVISPYNENFVAQARRYGGKWTSPAWIFDARDEARIRELCREVYGTDGQGVADVITLRVEWVEGTYADRGPLEVAGRPVARAFGRDSGASLAEGVVVLEGKFGSSGSAKNWTTYVAPGTIALVRDFPRVQAERLMAEPSSKCRYSIEPEESPIDRDALVRERGRLVERIAEIDALLAKGAL